MDNVTLDPLSGNPAAQSWATLAGVPRWLTWRMEVGERKTPYINGRQGWKRASLTRVEAETAAAELLAGGLQGGVAVVLGELPVGLCLCGLDLDTCRSPDGELTEWAQTELRALGSYAEISPSGTGVKAFFLMEPGAHREVLAALGKQRYGTSWKRGSQKHAPGIELYLGERWFTVTDNRLPDLPETLSVVPAAPVLELIRVRGPVFKGDGRRGGRSERVMRQAARIKRNGGSQEDLEAWIDQDDEAASWRADHDQRQVDRAWERAEYGASDMAGFGLNEDGVAQAFAARHRTQLRFDHTAGKWFVWTGTHWKREETRLAFDWSRKLCRDLRLQQPANPAAKVLASRKTAEAVETFARADRAFAVEADLWDRDPWLLSTPAGVVELRTGALREANQADFMSRVTAVAPTAGPFDEWLYCPKWMRFLNDATSGDLELIRLLQQYAGYCLTGSVDEHVLLFLYGPGGNGKGVFQRTLAAVMGDYALSMPMETFAAGPFDRHPTEIAMMRGARMCYASETEEGRAWAENRLKSLTGGDRLTARFMHKDFFSFDPTHKLLFIGNNQPRLRNVDEAARRRFMMAAFTHIPARINKKLEIEMKEERPAILTWAIEGCLDWQQNGLLRPAAVRDATDAYFASQDIFEQWIADRCVLKGRGQPATLYGSYLRYADSLRERPDGMKRFVAKLVQRGFDKVTIKGTQYYNGLELDAGWPDAGL